MLIAGVEVLRDVAGIYFPLPTNRRVLRFIFDAMFTSTEFRRDPTVFLPTLPPNAGSIIGCA